MGNWLVKAGNVARTSWNIVKSVGPILIAQSKKGTDAYVELKGKMAGIEAAKELMMDEGKMLIEVRKGLLEKYTEADGSERLRINRDLEYILRRSRELNIKAKAISYLSEAEKVKERAEGAEDISEHWMDKFNELAKARNEDWRGELLAKMLATEAAAPGSVTTRSLWLIGTLEEKLFDAFASILDVSSRIGVHLIIPKGRSEVLGRVVPSCALGENIEVGKLLYMLEETGLVADIDKARLTFTAQALFAAHYFRNEYKVRCKGEPLEVKGVVLTETGDSITRFYERKYNKLGAEIIQDWVASLNKEKFEVEVIREVEGEGEKN